MKRILVIFLSLLIAAPIAAQKKLTLQEAVSIALQKNTALIKTSNNIESARAQVKSAYGNLLPNLNVSTSWGWTRTDGKSVLLNEFNQPTEISNTSQSRSYSVRAGGGVDLFDGLANYANISQKEDNLEAARLDLAKMKQDIVYQTTDLYYTILNAEEMMKVREENVKYNQKFLETVQERNRLGAVAIADVYSQQVQLGNAELLLIQAQNSYETSKTTLLNFLALNVLDEYEFVDPFGGEKTVDTDKYMKDFEDIQTLVNVALSNRFDYQAQKLTLRSAESGVTIAKGGLFPSLSGTYSYSTSALEPSKLFDYRTLNIGLTLSIPIFSNWNTESSIQFAQVNAMNANEDLLALERQIKIDIKQGSLDLTAAKKSLDVATKNVTSAEENRRIKQERYNLGSGTILDVLQADRDYTDAMRSKIDAVYNFYRMHDKLNNSLGRLDFKKFE